MLTKYNQCNNFTWKFTWNNAAEESFQRIKRELREAPVIGMPTEKRTGVERKDILETDSLREQSLE